MYVGRMFLTQEQANKIISASPRSVLSYSRIKEIFPDAPDYWSTKSDGTVQFLFTGPAVTSTSSDARGINWGNPGNFNASGTRYFLQNADGYTSIARANRIIEVKPDEVINIDGIVLPDPRAGTSFRERFSKLVTPDRRDGILEEIIIRR
jgi:hypothetical protein